MTPAEFAELQAFVEVAQRGSFARAAAHLGVTRSAVSQSIKQLETRLGMRLLNRTTRSVAPTRAGEILLEELRPVLQLLQHAVASALERQKQASGSLRITVSRVAARLILAPRLAEFVRHHPRIALEVSVEDRLVDIIQQRFDAGIRRGELIEPNMIARRLTPDARFLAVASPGYLALRGAPAQPRDLTDHACIQIRRRRSEATPVWHFRQEGKEIQVRVAGPLVADDASLALQAAVEGLGIARLAEDYIADELASGRLIPVLEECSPARPGFFLYYPGRSPSTALKALMDFLSAAGPR
jgi:DNA-binding transcriptional LysR family regulator